MKLTASSTRSRALGHHDQVAADERGRGVRGHAGQQGDAEVHLRVLLAGQGDVEVAGAHHADLAGPELQVEGLAVLGPGALGDVAGLDHVPGELEDLLDPVADQRLVARAGGLDLGPRGPHQRPDGEDVAAGAVAGQVVALDVTAEGGDLVGVGAQLGQAGRRLVGVEAGLLEQVLVVEEGRHVGVQRHPVEPVLEGGHRHVALAGRLQLRPGADPVGQVDQLLGLLELRGVDEVHAHQVGHLTGGDPLGDLAHHLRVGDVGQLDLAVRVLLVPRRDQHVDHLLVAARALPHGELAVAGAAGRGGRGLGGGRRFLAVIPAGGEHQRRRHQDQPQTAPHPTLLHVGLARLDRAQADAFRTLGIRDDTRCAYDGMHSISCRVASAGRRRFTPSG
jgi:hypothetical protein